MNRTGHRLAHDRVVQPGAGAGWLASTGARVSAPSIYMVVAVLAFLFLSSFAIRLYQVDEPPVGFHPTRQYRSLIIARDIYFQTEPSISQELRNVARVSAERQGVLEPPVMEHLVATGYRLTGGERIWLPHVLSSLFWLAGGGFLLVLAREYGNWEGATVGLAVYLFLPFAVVASRSFQPDPLMVMLMLASLLGMWRFWSKPTVWGLVLASSASAAAIFVKPTSLFIVATPFACLAVWDFMQTRAARVRSYAVFAAFCGVPAAGFYLYRIVSSGHLQQQAEASFVPRLLLDAFFWRGWASNVNASIGLPLLLLGFAGMLLTPPGAKRVFLAGMWAGYSLMCLTFSYHVATHDYYHLSLVPIVSLSLASLVSEVLRRARRANAWFTTPALVAAVLIGVAFGAVVSAARIGATTHDERVQAAEELGTVVGHSLRTVYLDTDYGSVLEYHGLLSGHPWPLAADLEWERLSGLESPPAAERLSRDFSEDMPEYFIVSSLNELEAQPDLERLLMSSYPIVAESERYIVFDMH